MAELKAGDRVRVVTREPSDEDTKSGLYYRHFGGLTGTIQKVYSKTEVAVDVEHDSLTKEIRKRHEDVREQMKTKWLDGLSEEGRSRLTEREKDFLLRYVILVGMKDLETTGSKPAATKSGTASAESPRESPATAAEAPARKTLAELEAAEEAELLRRASSGGTTS
jgi:ribosomal protein L21E